LRREALRLERRRGRGRKRKVSVVIRFFSAFRK